MSHPIGFSIKAATAARRQRRPGGGPERSEGIAVSPKEIKRGAFFATRFNVERQRNGDRHRRPFAEPGHRADDVTQQDTERDPEKNLDIEDCVKTGNYSIHVDLTYRCA